MENIKNYTLLLMIALLAICAIAASCSTSKSGCGNPARWEAKTKFNK